MSEALAMVETASHLAIRPVLPSDVPFIFSSWVTSYRNAKERRLKRIDKHARFDVFGYLEAQNLTVKRSLANCEVLVACSPAEPSDLYAYAVFEHTGPECVLHWLYTKQVFRRMGLAKHLLEMAKGNAERFAHSHTTEAWRHFESSLPSIHNPSLSR